MDTREIVETLGSNAVFGVLDERTRELLAVHAQEHRYRKGETVFVEGEIGDRMYVVVRGAVRAYCRSPLGSIIELARKEPGQIFGELALLDGGPRSASIDATMRSVLLSFHRDVFIGVLEREPKTIDPLLRVLGRMVRESAELAGDLVFLDIRGRLARRILRLAGDLEEYRDLTHDRRVTQTELAQMVGGSRQTVNGALHSLEADGVISVDADGIRILDITSLKNLAS